MKRLFFSFCLVFAFGFVGFGQVDTVRVTSEVDSLIKVSRAAVAQGDFEKAFETISGAEKIASEKLGKESAAYGRACFNYGRTFHLKNEFTAALKWYSEAKAILEKALGREHADYVTCLRNMANFYRSTGEFEKSERHYLETLAIRESTLGKDHVDYAINLYDLGVLYDMMVQYDKAEKSYFEARSIFREILGETHDYHTYSLLQIGLLYMNMGQYEKSEAFYLECKIILEQSGKKGNNVYSNIINNMAILYMNLGQYEKAEPLYHEDAEIITISLGKENETYASNLNNLGALYTYMGNFEKAEAHYLEALTIREKTLGKEHHDYGWNLNNLAVLYQMMGNYDKAEPLYIESIAIKGKTLGTEHPDYAVSLGNLAALYQKTERSDKAEPLLLQARDIHEKALGKEHPEYARVVFNMGCMYYGMSNFERAEEFLLESTSIRGMVLGTEHPDYGECLGKMASLHIASNNPNKAGPLLVERSDLERALISRASHHLSERELYAFLAKFAETQSQMLSFPYDVNTDNGEMARTCYDNVLFYKGFLLNSLNQVGKLVQGDSTAELKYRDLKSYKRLLAAQYAKPLAERLNLSSLEEKANDLEKDLARSIAGYGEAIRQVNWKEVKAALSPGEAAIEFVHFNYFNPDPTDSVMYAAMLLKPGMEQPLFTPLFEEKKLEALLPPPGKNRSEHVSNLYQNQALAALIWSPIEPDLQGVKTVYCSPSGLLHRLNMAALPSENGEPFSSQYEWVALGSTRQLVSRPARPQSDGALIFGAIQYDMDSTSIAASDPDELANRTRGLSFAEGDSTLRGVSWKYLKHSEKETANIAAALEKAGIPAPTAVGLAATEETFKRIGQEGPSPRILHVSTHGFFFPDPSGRNEGRGMRDDEPVFKISDHPMIRSGLILAGANHVWQTGRPLGNREDGILTAYEISQMDLRNTELVVLSACETGLGDIRGNEGVYGLQRAFKIAGVKNLVMSLWQVPDFHTQELMTLFYQKWLLEKIPLRRALHAAQDEMRRKGYEPFYWAGFVLVE